MVEDAPDTDPPGARVPPRDPEGAAGHGGLLRDPRAHCVLEVQASVQRLQEERHDRPHVCKKNATIALTREKNASYGDHRLPQGGVRGALLRSAASPTPSLSN